MYTGYPSAAAASIVYCHTMPQDNQTAGRYPFNFCRTGIFGKRGQPRDLIENFSSISFPVVWVEPQASGCVLFPLLTFKHSFESVDRQANGSGNAYGQGEVSQLSKVQCDFIIV